MEARAASVLLGPSRQGSLLGGKRSRYRAETYPTFIHPRKNIRGIYAEIAEQGTGKYHFVRLFSILGMHAEIFQVLKSTQL